MSELSPAAQAVKNAVLALYSDEKVHKFGWQLDAPTVASALRAAANEVALRWGELQHPSDILNAIADELEGSV